VPLEQVDLAQTLVEQLGDLAGRKPGRRRARRARAAV
jgi:hypothetical protein